jgi:hypothetical protein
MAGPGLAEERVVRPLDRPLSLHLGGEAREAQHHLAGGAVECALLVREVEEHADAGVRDALQRPRRLDGLAAEA